MLYIYFLISFLVCLWVGVSLNYLLDNKTSICTVRVTGESVTVTGCELTEGLLRGIAALKALRA